MAVENKTKCLFFHVDQSSKKSLNKAMSHNASLSLTCSIPGAESTMPYNVKFGTNWHSTVSSS